MKDSKAVRLIASAYDEGQHAGFAEGCAYVRAEYEGDSAWVKSRAYEMGHARGLEEGKAQDMGQDYDRGYAKGQDVGYAQGLSDGKHMESTRLREIMVEARESERQKIEADQPKLSVRFMPPGKPQFEMVCGAPVLKPRGYEPNKIEGILAIRAAYDGLGLKEAKDLVETDADGLIPCGEALPQSKAVALYLRLYDLGYQVELRKP